METASLPTRHQLKRALRRLGITHRNAAGRLRKSHAIITMFLNGQRPSQPVREGLAALVAALEPDGHVASHEHTRSRPRTKSSVLNARA